MTSIVDPHSQIAVHLKDVIASFGADPSQVCPEATFEDLDVDSLDLVELAQIIEEDYGVALQQENIKQIKTVGEAIALVEAKLEAGQATLESE